jgi:hypothetical protein
LVVVAVDDELSEEVDEEDESEVAVELSELAGAADDAFFDEPPRLSVL